MLATRNNATQRRGIVLVLVLAMLGLLALIAVTFAAYAAQAKVNTRNFALAVFKPQADELFDFAMSQLVGDTADVRSVIRGHSLARDMYGNDAVFNGYLTQGPSTGQPFLVTNIAPTVITSNGVNYTYYTLTTNILSNDPGMYGYNFTRWIIRMTYTGGLALGMMKPVDQTFEILTDNMSGTNRTFLVSPIDTTTGLYNPTLGNTAYTVLGQFNNPNPLNPNTGNLSYYPFILDGRYLHAFNGTGLSSFTSPATFNNLGISVPESYYGNFRFNPDGLSPNQIGMDEDYDACDLDNWFLAIQSADGQVVIPSFHRPGIIRHDPNGLGGVVIDDWLPLNQSAGTFSADSAARILRPIQNLGNDAATFPDLIPDSNTGKITYDVDNDGDGLTDSVWLDLGYPARRDSRGKLYKPLFAFMVIGLNGRIPLNTAGNLAGNVGGVPNPVPPPATYYGGPAQATHLGNSTGEIDPTYALQNALDASASDSVLAFMPPPPASAIFPANFTPHNLNMPFNTQVDSTGIDVRLTQLRNLLSGTRPQPNPTPGISGIQPYLASPNPLPNGDLEVVFYSTAPGAGEQQPYLMPNGIASLVSDQIAGTNPDGTPYVFRKTPPVAGRWGEASSVQGVPFANPYAGPTNPNAPPYVNVVSNRYSNPPRAGYSQDVGDLLNGAPRDAADDNFNAFDPFPLGHAGEVGDLDFYDLSGALMLPVDRIRRFVTPIDINGTGSVSAWGRGDTANATNTPARNRGSDSFGRVKYASYFRPAGLPGVITPGVDGGTGVGVITYPWTQNQAYQPDITNNPLHGFETFRYPGIASYTSPTSPAMSPQVLGGAPFDLPAPWSATSPVPTLFPTYDTSVNSTVRSDGVNEAEEMNLYTFNPLIDSPFGPSDLEWLYRQQDVDGSSMSSRLSRLAPISFTNGLDGLRRRRMFALDSFESNGFVWAYDNPGGAFPYNSSFYFDPNSTFPLGNSFSQNGSGILQGQNASMLQIQQNVNPGGVLTLPLYPTPILAQRDRKINLNMPFPVSNNPNEPIRQRWISDVYQLMKVVLPPRAVDTPEELAQLSQYIINIVDFRDPDATMTHWVNPDVVLYSPILATASGGTVTQPVAATPPMTLMYQSVTPPAGTMQLDQYGMEYNPVAINEALMFAYSYSGGTAPYGRFMIELVNTQVQAGTMAPNGGQLDLGGAFANPSALTPYDSGCWDIVFLGDDPYSRPDPYGGQLPVYGNAFALTPLNMQSFGGTGAPMSDVILQPLSANPTSPPTNVVIPPPSVPTAASLGSNYFYVFGNAPSTGTSGAGGGGASFVYEAGSLQPGMVYSSTPIAPSGVTTYGNPYVVPAYAGSTGAPAVLQALNATAGFDPLNGATSPTWMASSLPAGVLPMMAQPVGPAPPNYQPKVPLPVYASSGSRPSSYVWVCLRRPANPFAPVSLVNPMLVVDSMRVPYVDGTGASTSTDSLGNPAVTGQANTIYSAQRLQPYRGGHAVPAWTATPPIVPPTAPPNPIDPRYGYSEQIVAPTTNSLQNLTDVSAPGTALGGITQGIYYANPTATTPVYNPATGYIYHTLGLANENELGSTLSTNPGNPENWDFFPFHDRDFANIAELMLVPASPPGLFTKQFAEFAPSWMNITNIFSQVAALTYPGPTFNFTLPSSQYSTSNPDPIQGSGTYAGFVPTWAASNSSATPGSTTALYPSVYSTATTPFWFGSQYTPGMAITTSTIVFAPPIQPHTFPYLSDRFFYTGYGALPTAPIPNYDTANTTVGGPAADGWFKMFEFLEVPTPMIGGIGPVMNGTNFDWSRQDSRPGQLNLNLIIDEEVFLSLLGKQSINQINGQMGIDQFTQLNLNFDQIAPLPPGNYGPNGTIGLPLAAGMSPIPLVVTSVLSNGSPASSYPMATQGLTYANPAMTAFDPISNSALGFTAYNSPPNVQYTNGLKASWVQFLSMRHGGSGFLYGFGTGAVGQNLAITPLSPPLTPPAGFGVGIPAEIPFHSLSYPDINYTVMRPAALPPTLFTTPALNTAPVLTAAGVGSTFYSADPGVRSPEVLFQGGLTVSAYQGYPSSASMTNTFQTPLATTNESGVSTIYYPYLPPPIPARRLFQLPDGYTGALPPGVSAPATLASVNLTTTPSPSNASEIGDPIVNNTLIPAASYAAPAGVIPPSTYTTGVTGTYYASLTDNVPSLYWPTGLANGTAASYYTFTVGTAPSPTAIYQDGNQGPPAAAPTVPPYNNPPSLGSASTTAYSTYRGTDFRQHPFWRSEEMQRVLNLTTVRTHQYAVWVTIGFFEVIRQGDLAMATSNTPWLAYDVMGPELRANAGATQRFREFVLVDRLRLTGFNHTAAGQFQPAIVYKKRIQ